MKRRAFVQRLPVLTAGLTAGASAAMIGGCASVPYLVPQLTPRGLSLFASELGPEGDAFVQAPDMERPVYVRRHASGSLTAVLAPAGHDVARLLDVILDRFDMALGVGLGKLAGRVFRIGHLGDFNDLSLMGTLAGVEMGLGLADVPHRAGGVNAAMTYLASCTGSAIREAAPA